MAQSLDKVIKKANSLADVISKRLAANAPRRRGPKGGNLREALKRANTLDTMLNVQKGSTKQIPIQSLTFTLNYAPDDAPYGMWWNDPTLSSTVKNGKTSNIPKSINFAEKTLAEPKVQSALNDIYDLVGDAYLAMIDDELKIFESEY